MNDMGIGMTHMMIIDQPVYQIDIYFAFHLNIAKGHLGDILSKCSE